MIEKLVGSADSGLSLILTRYIFVPAILVLSGISALYLRGMADKVENALPRSDMIEAQKQLAETHTKLWSSIANTTKFQTDLTASLGVLSAQLTAHKELDTQEDRNLRDMISDIQRRVSVTPPNPVPNPR